jgi:uncharacterized DUF497 family protein
MKDFLNQRKHGGITFDEASTVFSDPFQWTISDPDHSVEEQRYLTTGYTKHQRLVIVSHTEDAVDRVRIISARLVTAAERQIYEEGEYPSN